jgi:hypothetical protein
VPYDEAASAECPHELGERFDSVHVVIDEKDSQALIALRLYSVHETSLHS